MSAMQLDIFKLLKQRGELLQVGAIRNKLNGPSLGWNASLEQVIDALRGLEQEGMLECLWRTNQSYVQTPNDDAKGSSLT
jgi:hypothetical protein